MAVFDLRRQPNQARAIGEKIIQILLTIAATVSILTTAGIVFSLLFETIAFFREVSIVEFLTETEWTPLFSIKKYGIWPLVSATVLTSAIAMVVAVPLGLIAAIFLSEFASDRIRRTVKPLLEILAGIPTVVYGYFALTVVTPFLKNFIPTLSIFNSLGAGLVMGVMLIPFVASLSEDALSAVPNSLREAAYGLGSTRFEVATRVVAPAAISGIVASIVLAFSRAVGETMIVAIAAGQNPRFTFDPTVPVMTMTSYIVQVSLGDTPYGSLSYYTLYAVGFTLFLFTFVLNIFSYWMVRKFREVYD
ncbi:MAG TPA: phosphate ABC transporter permease subunit PstC [Chloroflexus aurantiacus]|uniref:Phosphate transport system permease protein n=1 Tax=Chloroflexus aurantiacus (strain ATCC 29366 / DSM 635 / J-10-fl) TaxID=324602 RepID=A9WCU9_CHLAA|nr:MULTISPECIES: phosphate ABC transporter permease subunit PstC [Chloroflexus]ABY33518.1 phosphate ABC transporter, inner membrane subunit PstC [Chloroflexus aurantiacus J-10-fl]RMG48641.1 MAG: phosphate ABC transporter permease subunit PstC [Chloroflexota bacterium]HBW68713.1 phosphate ABC transporter permease subunit PstC [Chloroflexus aurantiacus]